jgi:hypothetical protein
MSFLCVGVVSISMLAVAMVSICGIKFMANKALRR